MMCLMLKSHYMVILETKFHTQKVITTILINLSSVFHKGNSYPEILSEHEIAGIEKNLGDHC